MSGIPAQPHINVPVASPTMKEWSDLTEAGKIRRLRPLAETALRQYPVEVTGIRSLGGFSNIIFRVDTPEGPLALRVDYQQDHTDETVEIELAWLLALGAETDLDVAEVVPTADGRGFVYAGADGVPGERRCVLFEWIPGRTLADNLTPERYHQLGRVSAGLHVHGAGFAPPTAPMAFDRLDTSRIQVTHGDLHPWNVHVARSRMIAFDFEDVCLAHPVQDVATTLFYERDQPHYADLRAAFEKGYRTVAEWPVSYDGELEHFMAARTVMFINYVLNLGTEPTEFYTRAFARLEKFLENWG
ncbi:MAG: phosphotransferase [Deltaproteobacteria bacterium]|nr:phosphotransferase [Deltaproteobacteria bacterium]